MAHCLISGLIQAKYPPTRIWVSDHHSHNSERLQTQWGISATSHNEEVVSRADILFLTVKPQVIPTVLTEIAATRTQPRCLLVSVAAGISLSQLKKAIPHLSLIRAMPNLPVCHQKGIIGLFAAESVAPLHKQQVTQVLQQLGETVWVDQESHLDILTALSGSGPAYCFYLAEGFSQAAQALGLPQAIAQQLVLHTFLGSAWMALKSQEPLSHLRAQVTSKGGITEKGIQALQEGDLFALLKESLTKALEQTQMLREHSPL